MKRQTFEVYKEIDAYGEGIDDVIELFPLVTNFDIKHLIDLLGCESMELSILDYFVLRTMVLDRDYNLAEENELYYTIHGFDAEGNIYMCYRWENINEDSIDYGMESEWAIHRISTFKEFLQEFIDFREDYRNFGKYINETKQLSYILYTLMKSMDDCKLKQENLETM